MNIFTIICIIVFVIIVAVKLLSKPDFVERTIDFSESFERWQHFHRVTPEELVSLCKMYLEYDKDTSIPDRKENMDRIVAMLEPDYTVTIIRDTSGNLQTFDVQPSYITDLNNELNK